MTDLLFLGFATPIPLARSRFAINLQWFAAEDEGRTEEPTEQKIRKAREEGKVAKSAELTSAIVLLFPIIAIAVLGGYLFETMASMIRFYLSSTSSVDITSTTRRWCRPLSAISSSCRCRSLRSRS